MTPHNTFRSLAGTVLAATALIGVPCYAEANQLTPWGDPDLEGLWDFRTLTPFERPDELAEQTVMSAEQATQLRSTKINLLNTDNRTTNSAVDIEASYNNAWYDWGDTLTPDLRTSLIVDPPDGKLPQLTDAAREAMVRHNLHREPPVRDLFSFSAGVTDFRPAGPEELGLSERCLVGFNASPHLTPSAYNNNLRIIQTPHHVLLVSEMIHTARVIPMHGHPRLPQDMQFWSGDPRGRWEGGTLVVETENFTGKTPTIQIVGGSVADATNSGAVGSAENFRLVERFTRTSQNTLRYEYTIDDPKTFKKPFTVAIPLKPADGLMFEYACHEGNYAIAGMLRGARRAEADDASLD